MSQVAEDFWLILLKIEMTGKLQQFWTLLWLIRHFIVLSWVMLYYFPQKRKINDLEVDLSEYRDKKKKVIYKNTFIHILSKYRIYLKVCTYQFFEFWSIFSIANFLFVYQLSLGHNSNHIIIIFRIPDLVSPKSDNW